MEGATWRPHLQPERERRPEGDAAEADVTEGAHVTLDAIAEHSYIYYAVLCCAMLCYAMP